MKIVKCPICGTLKKVTERQRFFKHCSTLFEVEKYVVAEGYSTIKSQRKMMKKIEKPEEIEIEIEGVEDG